MKKHITFRFYEELNDFLPLARRKKDFIHRFTGTPSIKNLIESIGVPHTEVELILVNGVSVDFNFQVQNNDRISVYPMFESLDMSQAIKLRKKPLRKIRFVLDCHLGKLTRYLRLVGFDCLFKNHFEDSEIARISQQEHRIVLTRDRDLLKRKIIEHGHYVHKTEPEEQFIEVIRHFDLYRDIKFFERCSLCNGALVDVPKKEVIDKLEDNTRLYFDKFKQCEQCQQIYWEGSHYDKIKDLLAQNGQVN